MSRNKTTKQSCYDRLYLLINFFLSQDKSFWDQNPQEFHAVYQELCSIKTELSTDV